MRSDKWDEFENFLGWCEEELDKPWHTDVLSVFRVTGILTALCLVLQSVQRVKFLPLVGRILKLGVTHFRECPSLSRENQNALFRKLCMKLIQRCGLVLLKPVNASWRYKRGLRSLEQNLLGKPSVVEFEKVRRSPA